jgi:hypothetical protein
MGRQEGELEERMMGWDKTPYTDGFIYVKTQLH